MRDAQPNAKRKYEEFKAAQIRRGRQLSLHARDIKPLPRIVNPRRKSKALRSFRFFCEAYFPKTFHLPWSVDHLRVIANIEDRVCHGGLFAMAMFRGCGKTSLCEVAAIWAVFTGHHDFVVLIAPTQAHARDLLDSVKTELETNSLLLEDFPEVVYPIRRLEGIFQRAGGQIYRGKSTHINWTADELVMPTIAKSKASAAVIKVAGLEGRIRGMKVKRPDGRTVRPSFVVLDDPQTDESARSEQQTLVRLSLLNGAILNLAGPGKKLAAVCPCTVIQRGDFADQLLDGERNPEWRGERTRLVISFPARADLWRRYADMRNDDLRAGGRGEVATRFYQENREDMDAGAAVSWEHFFNPVDEISAIQHAMNLYYREGGEKAFWSEFQNEPLPDEILPDGALAAGDIDKKLSGHPRRMVPARCTRLTAFIDIQAKLLFWMVCAWEDSFSGFVIDYGSYPEQTTRDFTLSSAQRHLSRAHPGTGLEGAIYAGLEATTKAILVPYRTDGGSEMRIERCLIDASWGQSTDVVYRFASQSVHSAVLLPSHGHYYGAASVPMSEYRKKPGDRVGLNWRLPIPQRGKGRYALYDTNYWKSFTAARFKVAMGDPGSLCVYGKTAVPHATLLSHLTSEYPVRTSGRGREVDEWKKRVEQADNHWWDCIVGCTVAASICGASLFTEKIERDRVRLKLSELKIGGRGVKALR